MRLSWLQRLILQHLCPTGAWPTHLGQEQTGTPRLLLSELIVMLFALSVKLDPVHSNAVPFSQECSAARDVTETRQPFPSFCPDDFELAHGWAKTALELAQAAAKLEPDSQVSSILRSWHMLPDLPEQPVWATSTLRKGIPQQ